MRGGREGEEQGEERESSKANDVWGARMHRNIGFCRELAVKAGNLVMGREGDREKGGGRRVRIRKLLALGEF